MDLEAHFQAVEDVLARALPTLPNGAALQVQALISEVARRAVEREAEEDPLASAGLEAVLASLAARLDRVAVDIRNRQLRAQVWGALEGAIRQALAGVLPAVEERALAWLLELLGRQ